MKPLFSVLFCLFLSCQIHAQALMSTVKEKTEITLAKRLTNIRIGEMLQNYVPNSLSITAATKNTEGVIGFDGVISLIHYKIRDNTAIEGHQKRYIKGTLRMVLDSWEVTSLQYKETAESKEEWIELL